MSRGTAILIAACAAAVVLPATAFGLGLPFWMDGVAALGVFGGTYLLARRPKPGEGLDADALADARNQTANGLTTDAAIAVTRLKRAAGLVQDVTMRGQIASLAQTGDQVLKDIREDPSRAMAVRRLLTFYLPTAASLAEGWRALEERKTPAPDRAAQTRQTMRALNEAFSHFADDLAEPQMQTLDLDLKVLNDALKSDLDKPVADAPPDPTPVSPAVMPASPEPKS